MTIEEYKQKFLELYEAMEKEHGAVTEIRIEKVRNPYYEMVPFERSGITPYFITRVKIDF